MISETAFINCENIPADMRGQFDKPWYFVGEAHAKAPYVQCLCKKCNKPACYWKIDDPIKMMQIVYMPAHQFITDDMLLVIVFFGVCDACGTVHWARSGAPFKRVRSCVPA